jgi:GTP-dependent phosphoenolpyruvate carboxykinase
MEIFAHANNSLDGLPSDIRDYVQDKIGLCQPSNFHVCNGSNEENQQIVDMMEQMGIIRRVRKYKNW